MKTVKIVLLGMFVCAIAIGFSAFNHAPAKSEQKTTDYYFKFIGVPGQEDDETLWVELEDENAYNEESCEGLVRNGCALITTNISGTRRCSPCAGTGNR